jgi:hypothetical protein
MPGELKIKDRRAWKSWQLATGMIIAAIVGMALNYHTVGASPSSSSGAYSLPPPSGSSGTTTTTTAASGGATTTSSTVSGSGGSSTTSTSVPDASTTTPSAASAPARVLVGPEQSHGDWTSPAFTITSSNWNIGWAFQCTPAPVSGSSFQIFVTPAGSTPSGTPAVDESGASGQSVTAETSNGQQTVTIDAPANCVWAVKVTGS